MKDYYQILGLNKEATSDDIKSAYKTLALKYHPDRNEGSAFAEEQFKNINEAYQTLSDSYKKEKYDLVFQYGKKSTGYQPYQTYTGAPKHERPYYQKYGKFDWRNTPRYAKANVYKIDKNYYRMMRLTIGALLVVSVVITCGNVINDHYAEQRAIKEARVIQNKLQLAEVHFTGHEYDSTFQIIMGLIKKYPAEASYSRYRSEYVEKIHKRGVNFFHQRDYVNAIHELNMAKTYISNQDLNIWYMIGECHEAIGSYQKAIHALDYVFIRESTDIVLALRIGDLYLKMNDKLNALSYYSSAKNIFKDRQSNIYGKAFELVVKPEQLDTSYFHLFKKRGRLNYDLANYEEASTDYNWAIFLNPAYDEGFEQRAECWHKMGNSYRACLDWNEAYQRGNRSLVDKIRQYCGS